ncbi:hypothetical protein [Bremerella sp.]|uniref:hypothetical protein n=1 Tax=Bremerella sp. TaxID=2795602 RepID=UPI00391A8F4C
MFEAEQKSSLAQVPVDAGTRLNVTYSFHESASPVSDKIVVVHHGILHTRVHFSDFIEQLNAQGIHVAMIDQQSELASWKNWIGLGSYATGMAAACRQIEAEQRKSIGGFVYHSMGAAIGEKMQGRSENQALRLPTVFIAPIPVCGAWPIFTRLLRRRTWDLMWAILKRDVLSLVQTYDDVDELFFDKNGPPEVVEKCLDNLKHSPFYAYLQLTFRFVRILPTRHNEQKNMLVTSPDDYIFYPNEYPRTLKLYRAGEEHPGGGMWLTVKELPGGHDLFMVHSKKSAEMIASFFHDAWQAPRPAPQTRVDESHDGVRKPTDSTSQAKTVSPNSDQIGKP